MSPSQEFPTSDDRRAIAKPRGLQTHYTVGSLDPVYHAKAKILNDALQEIDMGRFQWYLFIAAGFGWTADELMLMVKALIYTSITREFDVQGEWIIFAHAIGRLFGAIFWCVGCDVWGRRWSFHLTILITSVFSLIAAAAPNNTVLCICIAMWSFGVGGNIPIDLTIFIEFVPTSHRYMLTVLCVWWSLGDLVGSLLAWPLISNFSCPPAPAPCSASSNKGWRYCLLASGGLIMVMWAIRLFAFDLPESPVYLMSRGRDKDAVAVVQKVATINGKISNLTLAHLKQAEILAGDSEVQSDAEMVKSTSAMRKFSEFHASHVRPLFATRVMTHSTSILIVLWALIGLATSLYFNFQTYFLQTRGAAHGIHSLSAVFRDQVISIFLHIPAALMAGYLVEVPIIGRRRTLAIFTVITGVFALLSTTASTYDAFNGWNCGLTYSCVIVCGVLYAMSMELFPIKARGTGYVIAFTAYCICNVGASIIAIYANINTSLPILISGAVLVLSGFIALLLPIEPRGNASIEK
ncbi:hypothetical protein SCLCIDRAFT_392454 [Scleroderma citrinum Foug A]|uniref:Major facilitator superfamily (MFS) profile domain-containing protein n=1 Tax=Scleroderma citrinum Foug A TaxID=1036808 RepID=A0A0C2ZNK7_9AGAM|nr:hypothetical protein SCLCIDRAFT_392454 [Scleroderma citrinum Foug A]